MYAPAGWTRCDGDCEHRHDGPFGWITTEGWQTLDSDAVARGLSYDHGVSLWARDHERRVTELCSLPKSTG
jgi:hypothetical protein